MGMVLVDVTAAVDVRPHVADPCHREMARVRALSNDALLVGSHAVGEVAGIREQLDRGRSAPAIHVPARLPPALIGLMCAWMGFLALRNDAAKLYVEGDRIGYVVD